MKVYMSYEQALQLVAYELGSCNPDNLSPMLVKGFALARGWNIKE